MRIVIIGGHGKVALLLAPLLVEAGHQVESVIRNPEHADEVRATGAEAVVADVETLEGSDWIELLRDRDVVIWSAGAGGGNPERTYAVDRDAAMRSIDAASAAGVDRYVMVSYVGSGRDEIDPESGFYAYSQAKAAADAHLRASDLNWTILAPGRLTDGCGTGMLETGEHVTSGDTARANVARLAVQVAVNADLSGITLWFRDGHVPIAEVLALMGTPVGS